MLVVTHQFDETELPGKLVDLRRVVSHQHELHHPLPLLSDVTVQQILANCDVIKLALVALLVLYSPLDAVEHRGAS